MMILSERVKLLLGIIFMLGKLTIYSGIILLFASMFFKWHQNKLALTLFFIGIVSIFIKRMAFGDQEL